MTQNPHPRPLPNMPRFSLLATEPGRVGPDRLADGLGTSRLCNQVIRGFSAIGLLLLIAGCQSAAPPATGRQAAINDYVDGMLAYQKGDKD